MDYEDICRRDKKGPPGSARTASSFPWLYARVQSAYAHSGIAADVFCSHRGNLTEHGIINDLQSGFSAILQNVENLLRRIAVEMDVFRLKG